MAKSGLKKFLRRAGAVVGGFVLLVIGVILLVWSYPEKILTSERVSGFVAPLVRVERAPDAAFSHAPLVFLEIGKDGFTRRSLSIRLAPGCYALAAEPPGGTEACLEAANLGISFRLSRRTFIRLTGLDRLELKVTRGKFAPTKGTPEPEAPTTSPGSGFAYLRYLDRGFKWGPIAVQIENFEAPSSRLKVGAKLVSAEAAAGKRRTPKLDLEVAAESPEWIAGLDGEIYSAPDALAIPKASVTYRSKPKGGGAVIVLAGEVAGTYAPASGDLDATFSVNWRRPTPEIELLKAENGVLRLRKTELSAKTTLKAMLQGKTPLGRLPILTLDLGAALRPAEGSDSRPIDVDLSIAAYQFAGVRARSDLAFTLIPGAGRNELRWRKGELRIEAPDFANTVKQLSRTSWAIPVPFNVFRGPIVFKSEPFRAGADRTTLPFLLTTDLASAEQAFAMEARAELDLAKKDLGPLGLRVEAALKKVQFRLPDYDPLAPVPALARDPRIVRYAAPEPAPKPSAASAPASGKSLPLAISVKGPPNSIVLLNRFFEPRLAAGVDLASAPETGALKGNVALSTPFEIHYLNRDIRMEQLEVAMRPALEVTALVSMERSGYRIEATLHQRAGKTQIELGSKPPLSQDEIVSLLLYGMPKNSISSEQTRSVGSAQAAMGSEALGIFSFWAFASTPVESVLYDPETQTYSAVVRLPGGVVASIGSNWDNERQLALSKSLGRNWAVSTELIKDSEGVDRGGTLLRWRKSY